MQSTSLDKITTFLRWAAFVPGAVVTAQLAWIIIYNVSAWSLGRVGVEENSFLF